MPYDQIDALRNWRLLKGSHSFPGSDGGTCINEAAIVAAGFPYREVTCVDDMPECFSRNLSQYALVLNDTLGGKERQKLIPFVTRLAGTADSPDVEMLRDRHIRRGLALRVLPIALRVAGLAEAADALVAADTARASVVAEAKLAAMQALRTTSPDDVNHRRLNYVSQAATTIHYALQAGAGTPMMCMALGPMIDTCKWSGMRSTLVDEAIGVLDSAMGIGRQTDDVAEATIIANLRERAPAYEHAEVTA